VGDEESTRPQWQSELTEDFLREQARELASRDPNWWWEIGATRAIAWRIDWIVG
jgi:hypothetical protein